MVRLLASAVVARQGVPGVATEARKSLGLADIALEPLNCSGYDLN